jgi:AraC-like DNA-binding protein
LNKQKVEIPSFELVYHNQQVDFAIKRVQDATNAHGYKEEVPHRHNYYSVLWPIEMSGTHIIDYKEYPIIANHIFFVSPEQVHQVFINDNTNGILLMFNCGFLDKYFINKDFISNLGLFTEIAESPPVKIDSETAVILDLYTTNIFTSFNSPDQYKFEKIGAWLKLFLIECNKFASVLNLDNPQALQSSKTILLKFKKSLDQNFQIWRQVNDYANDLNISPDYLNSVVKSGIGKTAKELIQQRIVIEAKRLGIHTELSTKEIAYKLGFEDPSHFSRFFKNIENQSFSDFRLGLEKFLYK